MRMISQKLIPQTIVSELAQSKRLGSHDRWIVSNGRLRNGNRDPVAVATQVNSQLSLLRFDKLVIDVVFDL